MLCDIAILTDTAKVGHVYVACKKATVHVFLSNSACVCSYPVLVCMVQGMSALNSPCTQPGKEGKEIGRAEREVTERGHRG